MPQPVWITDAGLLETIPEGVFYSRPIEATAGSDTVYYRLIAGELPDGIQVTTNGVLEGTPKNVISVQGVPTEVSEDVTSTFAIRAYTQTPSGAVDRINDRTFSITVTGQDIPDFITPAGRLGEFVDGVQISIPIEISDPDPNDVIKFSILNGSLPPGITLDPSTGVISGIIIPDTVPPITPVVDYEFSIKIFDGKNDNVRAFSITVYSRLALTGDDTFITGDNTFLTADLDTEFTPVLLNTPGNIGTYRSDNFFAYKFDAIDFNGDEVEFLSYFTLPPNLVLDSSSGWLYGYLADQGATEISYRFAIRVRKNNNIQYISNYYYFDMTVIGNIDTDVTWITDPDLGVINNGAVSTLAVQAAYAGDLALEYQLVQGSDSKLPQGLTLQPTGHITGRVSFNTFAIDSGATTFDKNLNTRLNIDETTFDMSYTFTVNAYAPIIGTTGYSVASIVVTDGGTDYSGNVTVTISAPPAGELSVQATVGNVTVVDGVITAIAVDEPGQGYAAPPTVTITDSTGSGAVAVATVSGTSPNAVSVFRTFTVTVNREFNQPYEKLYIKCMPPEQDRAIIDQLVQNQDIIPIEYVYRQDDPNFGVASNVIYDHAYGLTASSLDLYVQSLDINHYWKNVVLGEIRTARALDANGDVLYEVVYSMVIDDLVNNDGESVGKSVDLAYPVTAEDIDIVYPNSLINMRDQVIDTVGQISPALPLWMTSKQENGQVLGFTPAWVICYTVPGASKRIAYNIAEQFGDQLNLVDFKIDRYEIDRSQTHNWLPFEDSTSAGHWIPYPPAATTFDDDTTVFDGGATRFISPADRWIATDEFDKYLVFPRTNILN